MPSIKSLSLTEQFLAILLAAATAQFVNAYAWSMGGAIAWSWIGSVLIFGTALVCFSKVWIGSPQAERRILTSAWAWPLPWLFLAVMLWQNIVYPPTMSDSLCYRLPRIFLWLQDGFLSRTNGPDPRMQAMPWGWEILALPLVAIDQIKVVGLLNLAAWIVVLQLAHHWAVNSGATEKGARWISLGVSSAPVFLLQASSSANDLFAAVLLMVSVHFILSFASNKSPARINLSLVAFMMACGVKPQFLVLGLGWGLWWLFGEGKPWKNTCIRSLAVAAPLALLVSPLPIFILNHQATGSFLGVELMPEAVQTSALHNVLAAALQFLFAQLQLPFVPGAERISTIVQTFGPFEALHSKVPKFEPGFAMIQTIDGASLGLFHAVLICAGIFLSLRAKKNLHRGLLMIAIIGFVIAGAKVVPGTIGRSFVGFAAILLPLAITGLAGIEIRRLKLFCIIAMLVGAFSLVLNPSSPAWPSRTLESYAKESGKTGIADKLGRYHAYQERAQTGIGILAPVQKGDSVAVLMRTGIPTVGLWSPSWQQHQIEFIHNLDIEKFITSNHRWLLIGDSSKEYLPKQFETYGSLPGWKVVSEKQYLPTLTQGSDKWTLYRRGK
ncbi:MAG: hypothetical protein ACSHX9_05090 [Luteolibacter sp.]